MARAKVKKLSMPEEKLALHIRVSGLQEPEREYRFHPTRKWRVDFAWPDYSVAVEVEGGIHSQGRHVRAKGFEGDCEKYNALAEGGWFLYRYTPAMIASGAAIDQIKRILQ